MAEVATTGLILYGDIEKVKQFLVFLLKSRQLSTYVHSYHKMNSFNSPNWTDEASSQHRREVPSKANTSKLASNVQRPACGGSLATPA
jgi:hypothetical protein